jgi:hypothetical protein
VVIESGNEIFHEGSERGVSDPHPGVGLLHRASRVLSWPPAGFAYLVNEVGF